MSEYVDPAEVKIPQEIRDKWQKIVTLLANVLKVPSALIMKVDFPSFVVLQSSDTPGNPFKRDQVFTLPAGVYCEKTMASKDKLLVPNALKDPEWAGNPGAESGMIAYLGFPLLYPDKKVFGTLCVLDDKENGFCRDYEDILRQFKDVIECHLELLWQRAFLFQLLTQRNINENQLKKRIAELEERLLPMEKGVRP